TSSPDTFTPLPVRTLSPPFQSGRFHPLQVWTLSLPSSPDTFTLFQSRHFHPPFQSGCFHPLPVRTLSPPASLDTFIPLPVQMLSPPSSLDQWRTDHLSTRPPLVRTLSPPFQSR
ncbi:unnamed protein product, partial [Staurois parvus]